MVEVVVPGDGERVLVEVTGTALTRGRDADDAVVSPMLLVVVVVVMMVGGIWSRGRW